MPVELLETSPARHRFNTNDSASAEFVVLSDLYLCASNMARLGKRPFAIASPAELLRRFQAAARSRDGIPAIVGGIEVKLRIAGNLIAPENLDGSSRKAVPENEIFVAAPFGADILKCIYRGYTRAVRNLSHTSSSEAVIAVNEVENEATFLSSVQLPSAGERP